MKVISVKDIMGGEIVGVYTTFEKAKEKIIEIEKEDLATGYIDEDIFNEEVGKVKRAKNIEKLNDLLIDAFYIQEFEVDS